MANHALSLPDPAGRSFLGGGEWSRTHAAELRRLGDVLKTWRRGEAAAPPGLSVRPPWFPHRAEYRHWSLRRAAVGADASLWRPVSEGAAAVKRPPRNQAPFTAGGVRAGARGADPACTAVARLCGQRLWPPVQDVFSPCSPSAPLGSPRLLSAALGSSQAQALAIRRLAPHLPISPHISGTSTGYTAPRRRRASSSTSSVSRRDSGRASSQCSSSARGARAPTSCPAGVTTMTPTPTPMRCCQSLYVLPGRQDLPGRLRTTGRRSPPPNTTAVVGRRLPALLDAE